MVGTENSKSNQEYPVNKKQTVVDFRTTKWHCKLFAYILVIVISTALSPAPCATAEPKNIGMKFLASFYHFSLLHVQWDPLFVGSNGVYGIVLPK